MGEKGVVVVVEEMGEGMQCVDHPYRSNPGGICAFCLQEKLGKLVSSSKSNPAFFPIPPLPPSSSSPPSSLDIPSSNNNNNKCMIGAGSSNNNCRSGRSSSSNRKVMASSSTASSSSSSSSAANSDLTAVLKRSKSVAPRPLGGLAEVISTGSGSGSGSVLLPADSPRKKNLWSFLYHHSSSSFKRRSTSSHSGGGGSSRRDLKSDEVDHEESPPSLGRKVSRSRSVGCGSRSFSGDFLERISTGFGDCTLRRVESQREAKKPPPHDHHAKDDEERMQRIKCGGRLFGMADGFGVAAGRMSTSMQAAVRGGGRIHHSRSSWGAWASFASPMRAFRTNASTRTYTVSAAASSAVNSSNNAPPTAPTTTTTTTTSKSGSNPSLLAAVGR